MLSQNILSFSNLDVNFTETVLLLRALLPGYCNASPLRDELASRSTIQ